MSPSPQVAIARPDRIFIDGGWQPTAAGNTIDVIDPSTEELYFSVAEAGPADMNQAIAAARRAFDDGQWSLAPPQERAHYLRAMAQALRLRLHDIAEMWPREAGILHRRAVSDLKGIPDVFDFYAGLADNFPFIEEAEPQGGGWAALVREPVGVVGAIVPWNSPLILIAYKIAPALLAGCTVVLKASPEAPGEAYVVAEIAESVGLPAGVLNIVTARREATAQLVRDPRIDKITFTGSTEVGRQIAAVCGDRVARCTLELGGKSAAVVLDDADIAGTAAVLAAAECNLAGQICSSLTRIIVTEDRHDDMVDALVSQFADVVVGDPFSDSSDMGPLAMGRQRDRVEAMVAAGLREGAVLAAGGRRPPGLDRGFYFEPTVFAQVRNDSVVAREEIFGPVLCVIPVGSEADAIATANDSIYGLNASVFTKDPTRAFDIARRLHSGTVGHNAFRTDFTISAGGFKQSGIGREGGRDGLHAYLESKTVILNGAPDAQPAHSAPAFCGE